MLADNRVIIAFPGDLSQSVDAELSAFSDFVRVLQTEQEALVQGDVDRLIELARLKSEKVLLLSQFAERRNRYLAANGHNPEQGGMDKWLQQHGGEIPHTVEAWKQLLEQAKIAQQINQVNGSLIETKLRFNQQALSLLQTAANQTGIYGPDGQTHTSGLGRPLGKV